MAADPKPIVEKPRLSLEFLVWSSLFLVFIYLCAVPVDAFAQIQLAAALLSVMFFIRHSTNGVVRIVFLLCGAFITLRYIFWRTFFTIELHDPVTFICAILLYLAELYGILIFLLGIFVNINPLYREPEPLLGPEEEWPTVDILIPTYNEDLKLLRNTVIAALQIRYPKSRMNVYLLDDGGTEQKRKQADPEKAAASRSRNRKLQDFCQEIGAIYVTREKNIHAKAGNINNALKHVTGELVLILDADHVPTSDFLEKTVGLFQRDPKLFLVQTPHFFLNPDPLERNLATFDEMPSENEMFYRVIQPGLDSWGASFFCGSAAVLRRSCLDLVGGIAGQTITEDAETALTIHSLGYHSAYIRYPLVAGLSPETFSGFIVQRVRWAQGMVQIFLLKNPMLQSGLSIAQRLCYLNSCFFWFFGFSRLIFSIAPCAFLLFGLQIYKCSFLEFGAFALPHLIGSIVVSESLFGRYRWSFVSEIYEFIQAIFTVPATIEVFMNPHAPKFAVTPKGEQLDEGFISALAPPFYALFLICILSLGAGFLRLWLPYPSDRGVTIVVLFWAFVNLFMVCTALGVVLERKQRRAFPRLAASGTAGVEIDETAFSGTLNDLSSTGASLKVGDESHLAWFKERVGAELKFNVDVPRSGVKTFNCKLQNARLYEESILLGLEFYHLTFHELRSKVALVYGDSTRWEAFQGKRESRPGFKRNVMFLLRIGFFASVSHFAILSQELLRKIAIGFRTGWRKLVNIILDNAEEVEEVDSETLP